MKWNIVDSGIASAEQNMRIDSDLLSGLSTNSQPTLHFYGWETPSATFGYFTQPEKFLNKTHKLTLAKRPTGGGIIFHLWDFTFSVVVPASNPQFSLNTLDNYAFVNNAVSAAIAEFSAAKPQLLQSKESPLDSACTHFCMACPTIYDVMIDGRKVCGGAQRRTRHGFLHQGSISLVHPDFDFLEKILCPSLLEAMKQNTHPLLQGNPAHNQIQEVKEKIKQSIAHKICFSF